MPSALPATGLRCDQASIMGMLLAAAAFALLTSVDTVFKLLSQGLPAYQILLVNAVFSVFPIIIWALLTGGLNRLHTERPFVHLMRGSISVMSAYCAIFAYSRLPLADYYAIVFTGPLIVTALSSVFLGEKVGRRRWLAIGIGFCGVLLAMEPFINNGVKEFNLAGRAGALASVFCYSLSVVVVRRIRAGESNIAFSFYGYLAALLINGTLFIFLGGPTLSISAIAHLAMSGFLSGISSICLMTAYHRSPVVLVAPFQYTQLFWGALVGWLLWKQIPGNSLIVGAAIVAASGLYVIYREIRIDERKKSA